jgi:hypothetical protein
MTTTTDGHRRIGSRLMASEPVGLVEIAERLRVKRETAGMWHYRSECGGLPVPMPAPRWIVSGAPAWRWSDIERWARKTGRMPAEE